MYLQYGVECCLHVVLDWIEQIEYLSGECSAFDSHDAVRFEELHELVWLDGSWHDHYLEWLYSIAIFAPFIFITTLVYLWVIVFINFIFEQCHEHIGINAPLMGLVEHKDIKHPASHQLPNCHSISHKCDFSFIWPLLLESNTIPDLLPQFVSHLLAYSLCECNCTDSPRLRD